MTPSDDDRTIIRPLASLTLTVREASGRVRHLPLATGELSIGRGEDNALVLDAADQAISRHHARLTVDGPVVVITDCGSTNGVYVNETKVERAELRPGDVARLGRAELVLEALGATATDAPAAPAEPPLAPPRPGKRPGRRLLLLVIALVVLLGLLFLAIFSGSDKKSAPPENKPAPAETAPTAPPAPAVPASPGAAAPATGSATDETAKSAPVSPEATAKSEDHFRQGMFFHKSGKLVLAITEWEKAVALDAGNAQAAKWLARAEGERDQLMDKQYREGLSALKYSRQEEAKTAFRAVAELCREKSDARCLDAARQLEKLEGQKP